MGMVLFLNISMMNGFLIQVTSMISMMMGMGILIILLATISITIRMTHTPLVQQTNTTEPWLPVVSQL